MRWRAVWLRWLAVFALVFATPITQQLVTQVASLVSQEDDHCADECGDGDCCPGRCAACGCCTQAKAVVVAPLVLPGTSARIELVGIEPDDMEASGYVSPPFRPPTA